MNKRYKAVIFDMDGLLIDSEPAWVVSTEKLLQEKGLTYTQDVEKKVRGMGIHESSKVTLQAYNLADDVGEFTRKRRDLMYELLYKDLHLMKGAKNLIMNLHKKGYLLAVATGGHTKEIAREIVKKLDVEAYFSVIVSSEFLEKGKPAPDIFFETAKQLCVDPSVCLVLEDAVNGIVAAKAAGMYCIGVNQDAEFQRALKNAGADKVVESLVELEGVL